jgi:hypothetical protein
MRSAMGLWGRRFRNTAEQGEWAEIRFVARAAEQRFRVSKPWGNTAPYDLMVEREGMIYRVQVKSTTCRVSSGAYPCAMPSGKRLIRVLKEIDFVAAYVIPLDLWYIIPAGVVKKRKGSISLAPWRRRSNYERYLEAWYLLRPWRQGEKTAGALKRARNRARVREREEKRRRSARR